MNIQPYLRLMSERNGSDLYFTTGAPVSMNVEGVMMPIGKTPLEPGMTREIANSVMDDQQRMGFEATMEMNLGLSVKDVAGSALIFTCSVVKCRWSSALSSPMCPPLRH